MKVDPVSLNVRERLIFMGSIVVPRPIAWITSVGKSGVVNLAPYSLFNLICYEPVPMVFVSPHRNDYGEKIRIKDTLRNIEETKEFVVNMVTEETAEAMNISAGPYPPEVSEVALTGLTTVPSDEVQPPRIAESPVNLECRVTQIMNFGKDISAVSMIIAEILRVHVRDELYKDGMVDVSALHVIARMGYGRYTRTREIFEMRTPQM
jgi:flavin reductase (DIM6/NTAB) family NADH-FMN oxidoreductase RutF